MAASPDRAIEIVLRPALATDAARLAEIRSSWQDAPDSILADEVDFLDRLATPHGPDYFCIAAYDLEGVALGYVIGGGSRELDRKAHGEVYELVVDRNATRRGIATQLLAHAIATFEHAAFAGTLLRVAPDDLATMHLALRCSMAIDPGASDDSSVRYERPAR